MTVNVLRQSKHTRSFVSTICAVSAQPVQSWRSRADQWALHREREGGRYRPTTHSHGRARRCSWSTAGTVAPSREAMPSRHDPYPLDVLTRLR